MGKVYISFSTSDLEFAELVRWQLEQRGIRTWLDRSHSGTGKSQEASTQIGSADVLVLIVSPASSESSHITCEWAHALGRGATVVPLLLRPATLHRRLAALECLDFTNPGQRDWESLAGVVRPLSATGPEA